MLPRERSGAHVSLLCAWVPCFSPSPTYFLTAASPPLGLLHREFPIRYPAALRSRRAVAPVHCGDPTLLATSLLARTAGQFSPAPFPHTLPALPMQSRPPLPQRPPLLQGCSPATPGPCCRVPPLPALTQCPGGDSGNCDLQFVSRSSLNDRSQPVKT